MFTFEKLSNDNFHILNKLIDESKINIKYPLDFYAHYDKKSFIYKYFMRKLVKLLKYDNKYIGYLWLENINVKSIRINDLYIKKEYIDGLDSNILRTLRTNIVIYEGFENEYNLKLLNKLNMTKYRSTTLLKIELDNSKVLLNRDNISFKLYDRDDRSIRCDIQNSVFKNESRVPLTISDIEFDEEQEYYINDLCTFITYKNMPIGYGQIIFNRGIYSAVNIGILEGFRGRGYGTLLIYKLMNQAKEKGIKELYIRVENSNIKAKRLYNSIGFRDVGYISNWIWNRDI